MSRALHIIVPILVMIVLSTACRSGDEAPSGGDALVKVGTASLSAADLRAAMPGGLNAEDSTRYARAYIRSWISRQLLSRVAANEIDMEKIDKMVEDYRNDLIMWEYTRRMFEEKGRNEICDDSIHAYYDAHVGEFITRRPLVKGVYLKVPENASDLRNIRRLYRSRNAEDIDKLEKTQLSQTVHYDFFRDNWIDWEQIETRIPYDFGSPDTWLRNNRNLDTTYGGFVYLLDISDIIPAGSIMPFEVARPQIIDRMTYQDRLRYEEQLRQDLYDSSLANGILQVYCEL